jgi:hypothetical protein
MSAVSDTSLPRSDAPTLDGADGNDVESKPESSLDAESKAEGGDAAIVDASVEADAGLLDATLIDADASTLKDARVDDGADTGNKCPDIGVYTANPAIVVGGEDVHLKSMPTDVNGDALTYQWTATSGTFVDSHAPNTTYHCGALGTVTITYTVSDGICDDVVQFQITCT